MTKPYCIFEVRCSAAVSIPVVSLQLALLNYELKRFQVNWVNRQFYCNFRYNTCAVTAFNNLYFVMLPKHYMFLQISIPRTFPAQKGTLSSQSLHVITLPRLQKSQSLLHVLSSHQVPSKVRCSELDQMMIPSGTELLVSITYCIMFVLNFYSWYFILWPRL